MRIKLHTIIIVITYNLRVWWLNGSDILEKYMYFSYLTYITVLFYIILAVQTSSDAIFQNVLWTNVFTLSQGLWARENAIILSDKISFKKNIMQYYQCV